MNPPAIVTSHEPQPANRQSLIDKIGHQAALTPDRVAVICGQNRLTFRELDERANRLASELVGAGVQRGRFVGIGLPRSLDLIVALLGVLKTGAGYIPIDPSYPVARIQHMIESSGIEQIVTSSKFAGHFPAIRPIAIDLLAGDRPQVSTTISPEDFIYAIFTSGSTGAAKAASVYHRGFSNLLDWYVGELGLKSSDTTLVISSPSFDLTQKNFFAPLMTGGTLILDQADNYDIHRISNLIRDHQVTLINCTPSAFYPLVDAAAADGFAALASLRFAVLGGESISIPRLRAWLEHPSCQAEVVNSYGPTECTDICAFHRLHRQNLDDYPFVPTGREIPNVTVTIRDEDLAVLSSDEMGELCIEGIGLGGGYLNDPERTASRFIGALYRTGDLARRLPDGVIEFRGRADHQVKVNGFRIELGEIEAILNTHPSVREAIVMAADQRLVAHVQGNSTTQELRDFLSEKLPAYMIPSEFHFVENFPLTPNGKIDRNALGSHAPPANLTTPASDADSLESKILALWSEILGRPVTDPTANFFDLGGTSIHLAIVHVRLRAMTGRDLSIMDLFAHPSARALAGGLSPQSLSSAPSPAQQRARLQQTGISNFRRPLAR